MRNPLKAVLDIQRRELPLALLMFGYFFLVITSFWILKPIKKSLFITFYDLRGFEFFGWLMTAAQAELLAKVLNMFVAFVAVVFFTLLARRLRRQQLTYAFSLFFIVSYSVYSFLLRTPEPWVVWTFYLFGDLFSTLMVATFFAFLNDSVTPDRAKRLYGLVGLGGVLGGVFGTSSLRIWITTISYSSWLWITLGIAVVIMVIAYFAGRFVRMHNLATPEEQPKNAEEEKAKSDRKTTVPDAEKGGNPALEGARLVFKSPYLLSIVAIVGLYEVISTIMDFQFTSTVQHYLSGDAIRIHFATVYTITNWVSFFVQLFLTSFIMTRFGLTIALAVLPAMILLGSTGFVIAPALWVGSMLNTADNGFSYSINQSAKETLYVPTTRDEKYKAKAFIDMFVNRFAKALAVGISLLITAFVSSFSSIRWLSLVVVLFVLLWLLAVRYAGRHFIGFSPRGGWGGGG